MKTKVIVGLLLTLAFGQVAVAGNAENLTNLLAKARALKSYHFKMSGTGIADPKDSGFVARMEITHRGELWARRVKRTTMLCETASLVTKPIEHPEAVNVFSNLVVFDGKKYYNVNSQNGVTEGIRLEDPNNTCKMFADAETILTELLKDPNTRQLEKTSVDPTNCAVFESSARYFAARLGAPGAKVEVAIDEDTGLPVRMSLKTKDSSISLDFEKVEVNSKLGENRFQPPKGVKFQDGEPDGLGGCRMKVAN